MIIVRSVFQLKFGKAAEAKTLWKEGRAINEKLGLKRARLMTDLVGDFYTVVLEHEFESLSAYEQSMKSVFGSAEWKQWYQRSVPLVESGRREIYTTED